MEFEICSAFIKAGIATEDAKAAAESIKKEINQHYALHAAQLATKGDLAEMESRLLRSMQDMQRWTITAIIAAAGLFAAISKMLH